MRSNTQKHGRQFRESMAKFGPGCGLLACLCAQIAMFRNLDGDTGTIGRALAGALVATLFGALYQNLRKERLVEKKGAQAEDLTTTSLAQGVLSVFARNDTHLVSLNLVNFLDQKQQATMAKAA